MAINKFKIKYFKKQSDGYPALIGISGREIEYRFFVDEAKQVYKDLGQAIDKAMKETK